MKNEHDEVFEVVVKYNGETTTHTYSVEPPSEKGEEEHGDDYACDICGILIKDAYTHNFGEGMIWISSSYGVCPHCYMVLERFQKAVIGDKECHSELEAWVVGM